MFKAPAKDISPPKYKSNLEGFMSYLEGFVPSTGRFGILALASTVLAGGIAFIWKIDKI